MSTFWTTILSSWSQWSTLTVLSLVILGRLWQVLIWIAAGATLTRRFIPNSTSSKTTWGWRPNSLRESASFATSMVTTNRMIASFSAAIKHQMKACSLGPKPVSCPRFSGRLTLFLILPNANSLKKRSSTTLPEWWSGTNSKLLIALLWRPHNTPRQSHSCHRLVNTRKKEKSSNWSMRTWNVLESI